MPSSDQFAQARRIKAILALAILFAAPQWQSSIASDILTADGKPVATMAFHEYWRRPQNDGILCLFLQLKSLGYKSSFAHYLTTIADKQPAASMTDLTRVAASLGYSLVPIRTSLSEISTSQQPLILHLEHTDQNSGYFVVPVHFTPNEVVVFHGPTARMMNLTIDEFRIKWTGMALAPTLQEPATSRFVRSDFWLLLVAAAAALFVFFRRF